MRGKRGVVAVVSFVAVAGSLAARADLPGEGWPQPRHDARRSGRSQEASLADPEVILVEPAGEALLGEPAALGCDLVVGNGGGDVVRMNLRGAGRGWRAAQALPPCGSAEPSASSVALDTRGQVLAGLSGDAGLAGLFGALCEIVRGSGSYAIDNNEWPPGADLRAELTPIYVDPWPVNPCTGADVVVTDLPSAGDVRYLRDGAGEMWLGGWWTDGGLVAVRSSCFGTAWDHADLHPTWPASAALAAGGVALDFADGRRRWQPDGQGLSLRCTPSLVPGGVAWAFGGIPAWAVGAGGGRLLVTGEDGALRWSAARFGGYAGGIARDEGGDALYAVAAPSPSADLLNQLALSLAAACESWLIDNGAYPPTRELAPLLVPTYVFSMPPNVLVGGRATWSLTPWPGNYSYESWNGGTEYRLGFWDAEGRLTAIVETGVLVLPATDVPAVVECRTLDTGALRFSAPLPDGVLPTPPMLTADGVVVGGSDGLVRCLDRADGHERWSVDAGVPLAWAASELPDGGLAWTHPGGLVVVDPADRVRFALPLPAGVAAAPSATADGVIYVGDLGGVLHAVRSDGSTAWSRSCTRDAAGAAGLTTTPLPHEGWIHVGRSDGRLVSLAPRGEQTWPPPLPGVLRAWRTPVAQAVRLAWPDSPLGPTLGEHYHLHEAVDPRGPWRNVLPHDFVELETIRSPASAPLTCWRLANATCGEVEPPSR